jgi:ERCC4-type nuclease
MHPVQDPIQIIADDREPADAVVAMLRRQPDVVLRIERLPVGDYLVDDGLLFERKTLPDLAQSIQDGRLFSQALRLAKAKQRTALVLEGRGRDLAASRMRREAIQGALAMLTLEIGIPILRSADAAETAGLMLIAARQRRAVVSGALPRHGHRPRGKRRLQTHILQGLPGVGPARAQHLIERFGSVEAVVSASASELAEVPGLGNGTATAIRWAVEEPAAAYGC